MFYNYKKYESYKYVIYELICAYKKNNLDFILTNYEIAEQIGAKPYINKFIPKYISRMLTDLENENLIKRVYKDDNIHKKRVDILICKKKDH